MNYLRPERLDPLARDYAMGLMHGGARRRFERVLESSRAAKMAVHVWQERLSTLAATVPPLQPRPQLWQQIERQLQPQGAAAPAGPGWFAGLAGLLFGPRVLGGALVGALVAALVLHERPGLVGLEPAAETLPASYVGLLADGAGKPSLLASSRRHGRVLTVKMLQPLPAPAGQVAVLWALPKDGGAPFRVGTVPAQGSSTIPLPAAAEKLFFGVSRLGVSFENDPAATAPTAEFALAGACVKLW